MNESPRPIVPTPAARPFAPAPASPPGGCGKPMLVGCGVLAILLGIGAIVFVVKAKSLLAYALGKLQAEVEANLPEDLDAGERRRLEAGFAATLERVRSGQIDPERLQTLQAELLDAAERSSRDQLTRDHVRELIVALEAFSGIEPPAGAPPEVEAPPGAEDTPGKEPSGAGEGEPTGTGSPIAA